VGDFPGSTGRTVQQSAPRIDNTAGKLTFGAVTFGDNPGPGGNGILASITFALQSLNIGKVSFAGVQIGDTANAFLTPDESIGSEVIPRYKIGDLNQDEHTNLTDLLIALKVTTGMNETWASPDADTDGDKKLGIQEVIYILQVVSGIRD